MEEIKQHLERFLDCTERSKEKAEQSILLHESRLKGIQAALSVVQNATDKEEVLAWCKSDSADKVVATDILFFCFPDVWDEMAVSKEKEKSERQTEMLQYLYRERETTIRRKKELTNSLTEYFTELGNIVSLVENTDEGELAERLRAKEEVCNSTARKKALQEFCFEFGIEW